MGVIYKTEEEKTEPKAREIMMGFVSFSGLPPFRQKQKKRPFGICSRADGKQGESPEFPSNQN